MILANSTWEIVNSCGRPVNVCLKCRTDMFATGVRAAHSRGDHTDRGHTADRRARSAEARRGCVPIQVRVDILRSDHHVGRHPYGHRPVLPTAVGHQTAAEEVHPVDAWHAVDHVIICGENAAAARRSRFPLIRLFTHTHTRFALVF